MISVTHVDRWYQADTWVMSHEWIWQVTSMYASCHTFEWGMSHIWMSRVTHMNEACHTYEGVMSHIWMSQFTHMKESYCAYEWVLPHLFTSHITWIKSVTQISDLAQVSISHATRMNLSCRTYFVNVRMSQFFMSHIQVQPPKGGMSTEK